MDRPKNAGGESVVEAPDVRARILETASDLFYKLGVRAVGIDLIIARSGVAKTSLYRHFRTKDELIAAFLSREDGDFWSQWDEIAAQHEYAPAEELEAHLDRIGRRIARPGYRGCPQINVAAEFADPDHPARTVAVAHKLEMLRRLTQIGRRLSVPRPNELGRQLALVIDGAFASGSALLSPENGSATLIAAARALIAAQSPANAVPVA